MFAITFTACIDDADDAPEREKTAEEIKAEKEKAAEEIKAEKEKAAEEIKAENLAEFKKIIGAGITNKEFELAISFGFISKLVDEADFDKLTFGILVVEDIDDRPLFRFEGDDYVWKKEHFTTKGSEFTLEKKGDEFILYVGKETKKTVTINGDIADDGEKRVLKIIYNTKTKLIIIMQELYSAAIYAGSVIHRFPAKQYTPKANTNKSIKSANQNFASRIATNFTGVHNVKVKLKPQFGMAIVAAYILKPEGDHYVKFTPLNNGKTKIQFCDANGNVSGDYSVYEDDNPDNDNAPDDYFYNTTHHFWRNYMPMALNLFDVNFTYNNTTEIISPGTSVMARARQNKNSEGVFPFFLRNLGNQDSGSNATIIATSVNTPSNFIIKIKLDFDLDFHCIITKIINVR